ncbi:MAG: hypothetical protein ABIO04_03290 [Ferruginibacter sp.]
MIASLKYKANSITKPIVLYVWIAFVLNISQICIWKFGIVFNFSSQPGDNVFIYNTHSIVRLLLFSWFFLQIKQSLLPWSKKLVPVIFIIFILVNFIFFERFTGFSSRTLSLETGLLLFNCLLFYFNISMQDQELAFAKDPAFWITTGLSIYVVVNFPIFLFYNQITARYENFAVHIWDLHNITYIILCLFIARGFFLIKTNIKNG